MENKEEGRYHPLVVGGMALATLGAVGLSTSLVCVEHRHAKTNFTVKLSESDIDGIIKKNQRIDLTRTLSANGVDEDHEAVNQVVGVVGEAFDKFIRSCQKGDLSGGQIASELEGTIVGKDDLSVLINDVKWHCDDLLVDVERGPDRRGVIQSGTFVEEARLYIPVNNGVNITVLPVPASSSTPIEQPTK